MKIDDIETAKHASCERAMVKPTVKKQSGKNVNHQVLLLCEEDERRAQHVGMTAAF
jgi:hypothetical protein